MHFFRTAPEPVFSGIARDRGGELRYSIVLLRWLTIIATSYAVLFGAEAAPTLALSTILVLFLASNVALHAAPERWFRSHTTLIGVVVLDSLVTSLILLLSPQSEQNIVILYFFVMLVAAIGTSLRAMASASAAISGLYLFAIWQSHGVSYLLQPQVLLRVPFLFCAGLFYGYLSETARRRSDAIVRAVFARSLDAISVHRLEDGRTVEVNDEFLRLTGFDRDQVIGRTTEELDLWSDRDALAEAWRRLQHGEAVRNLSVELRARDGRRIQALVSLGLVTVDDQVCALSFVRDVTEVKELEQQLNRSQKLDAIGRLAGGIAHDFNNLLAIVRGSVSLLRAQVTPDETVTNDLEAIDEAAARAADLTRQLLAFTRQERRAPRVLDMNEMIEGMSRMLRRIIGEDVALEFRLAPDLRCVRIDSGRFEQLVVNLAVNAREALPRGGHLVISTENLGQDSVRLTVKDDGVGMTDDVKAHLFEPFFTTKDGKGTGLGLATCYAVVTQAGGRVSVDSEVGAGTTFRFDFPAADDAPDVIATPVTVPQAGRGSERILVVEDEPDVRRLTGRILRAQGYSVVEVESGDEALSLVESGNGPAIDLLVSDVVMPGLRGTEVARRLRERKPDLRVLLISGYAERGGDPTFEPDWFLQKPFAPDELQRAVRRVLDTPAPGGVER